MCPAIIYLLKVDNRNTKTMCKVWCFHYWLWTSKCLSGSFRKMQSFCLKFSKFKRGPLYWWTFSNNLEIWNAVRGFLEDFYSQLFCLQLGSDILLIKEKAKLLHSFQLIVNINAIITLFSICTKNFCSGSKYWLNLQGRCDGQGQFSQRNLYKLKDTNKEELKIRKDDLTL